MTAAQNTHLPSFAIIICSRGRRDILTATIHSLRSQSIQACQLLVVVTGPEDIDEESIRTTGPPNVEIVFSEPGLTRQRNAGIAHVAGEIKYVCFFDDDIELHRDYIRHGLKFLEEVPTVMAFSGAMLRERCASHEEARALVDAFDPAAANPFAGRFRHRGRHWILHGCNMVIRASILAYERFDERLPLYSYYEDYDISIRIRRYGYVGRFALCAGVHLQAASGRVSGQRLGYSQIANNWYFLKKGICHLTFPLSYIRFIYLAARLVIRNAVISLRNFNHGEAPRLLKGNLLALRDILCGSSAPENILQLPS